MGGGVGGIRHDWPTLISEEEKKETTVGTEEIACCEG